MVDATVITGIVASAFLAVSVLAILYFTYLGHAESPTGPEVKPDTSEDDEE